MSTSSDGSTGSEHGQSNRWVLSDGLPIGCIVAFWPCYAWWVTSGVLGALGRVHPSTSASFGGSLLDHLLALGMQTAFFVWLTVRSIMSRFWALEVDDAVVALTYRGKTKWRVAWADVRSWRPETYTDRGSLIALLMTDHAGVVRRLSLGPERLTRAMSDEIIHTLAQRAPHVESLSAEAKYQQLSPRVVVITLAIVAIALVLLWQVSFEWRK